MAADYGLMRTLTRRDVIAGAGTLLATGNVLSAQPDEPAEEIIDIHAHIISSDPQRYPPAPLGGKMSEFARTRPQTYEQYVAQADNAGVSKAGIVQVSTYFGVDDSYLIDSVARNPRRFVAVGSIDCLAPDNVQVLDGWVRRGMTGLRIFTLPGDDSSLMNPKADPVWDYVEKKGMTACISTQNLEQFRAVVQRHPHVKIVLDHTDFLELEEGPPYSRAGCFFELSKFRNFYIKATPTTFRSAAKGKSTPGAFMQALVSAFGADRIAFGSDLPSMEGPLTALVAEAKAAMDRLSAADRAMIFAGTAKRLYPALA
jgi:predicted TIM-barrel fold metal-dependent hydrolase